MTVALSYVDAYGYVKFSVTGAPAGYTLKRLDPFSTTLQTIVGYESSGWISGGAGYGEDYRPPLGTSVKYVLAPVTATIQAMTMRTSTHRPMWLGCATLLSRH